jgi:transcriptional repressor NrdR
MHCPFCDADKESLKVIDSRTCDGGRGIRRRRRCLKCGRRFTTYERVEENVRLTVVKRDGRRMPWDRGKILAGLERACFKRPVPESELVRLADEVEEEVFAAHDREVQSSVVGELVTNRLRRLDQVAYVRFASVYKRFKTLEELVDEARAVIAAHHYEDPSQGKLFTDASEPPSLVAPSAPAAGNGENPPPSQMGKLPARRRRGQGGQVRQGGQEAVRGESEASA